MSRTRQIARPATLCRSLADSSQVRAFAFDLENGHRVAQHAHDWHQLIYASRGVMTVDTPDGSWVVPPHRGVWVPAFTEHSLSMLGAVAMRTLYVRPDLSRSLPAGCCVVNVSPLLRELVLHAVELGRLDRRDRARAHVIGVIVDQLRRLPTAPLQVPEPRDPIAQRAARLVRASPDEASRVSELSHAVGASKRTLERLFKAQTGMTIGRWRQQTRFAHALRLLAQGRRVTRVAFDCGYESPSAFVSAFRRTFGTTPGRYYRAASTPGARS